MTQLAQDVANFLLVTPQTVVTIDENYGENGAADNIL